MKHVSGVEQQHAVGRVRSSGVEILPLDLRNPGTKYLRWEIDTNRKSERWLILKAGISLLLVAILITIRLVYFT